VADGGNQTIVEVGGGVSVAMTAGAGAAKTSSAAQAVVNPIKSRAGEKRETFIFV
jgi:hypothetical protein